MIEFNRLPPDQAQRRLFACFALQKWARQLTAGRPYADLGALLDAAEKAWSELAPSDWTEALAGHPRIGEGGGSSPDASEREQSGVRKASEETLAQLAEANRAYTARFGHVFLIAAGGRGGEDILAALRERMRNDPATEARVTATEHRTIARLRLEALAQP